MRVKRKEPVNEAHMAQHKELLQGLNEVSMEEAMLKIKSLEKMLEQLDFRAHPEIQIDILLEIGVFYGQRGEREIAESYFLKVLPLTKKPSLKIHRSRAESNLAICKATSGKYHEAIEIWKSLYKNEANEVIKQYLLNNISVGHGICGNYNEAINYAFQALELAQKRQQKELFISPYINLSNAYQRRGEKSKALEYARQALEYARELKNVHSEMQCLNNACVILNDLEMYEEALVYAKENLELRLKYLATPEHGMAYNNLGIIYQSTGKYQEALQCFKQAYATYQHDTASEHVNNTIVNIASVYCDMQEPDKALEYLKLAEPAIWQLDRNDMYIKYYRHYSNALKQKGRLAEALEAQTKLSEHIQQMYQENLKNSINKFEAEYYQKQIQTQAEEYKKQNAELKHKNLIIKRKSKELDIANKNMQDTVETLNWLVSVISHDVRAPLGSFAKILDMAISGDMPDIEIPEILKDIRKNSVHIYNLVNEMLDGIRLQRRKLDDSTTIENQDILPVLQQISTMYQPIAQHKGIRFRLDFADKELFARVDSDFLKIVVRNLLNNAVKFTPAGGEILLGAALIDNVPVIKIADTGKGMSASELKQLMKPGATIGNKSHNSEGIGLGWVLCRDAIKKMKGSMDMESGPGKGTTISICLPISE